MNNKKKQNRAEARDEKVFFRKSFRDGLYFFNFAFFCSEKRNYSKNLLLRFRPNSILLKESTPPDRRLRSAKPAMMVKKEEVEERGGEGSRGIESMREKTND